MTAMTAGSDDTFVGREREMAELTAALEDTIAGRGRLVMLVGEPGIGKTRTAEELAVIARQRGAEVLWGHCPEERGAPPYWPLGAGNQGAPRGGVQRCLADTLRQVGRGSRRDRRDHLTTSDNGVDRAPPWDFSTGF
jgi:predicted ATPase